MIMELQSCNANHAKTMLSKISSKQNQTTGLMHQLQASAMQSCANHHPPTQTKQNDLQLVKQKPLSCIFQTRELSLCHTSFANLQTRMKL